jgi:hypothetical protein
MERESFTRKLRSWAAKVLKVLRLHFVAEVIRLLIESAYRLLEAIFSRGDSTKIQPTHPKELPPAPSTSSGTAVQNTEPTLFKPIPLATKEITAESENNELRDAVKSLQPEKVERILKMCSPAVLNSRNTHGKTVLHTAVEKAVGLFLRLKAKRDKQQTPSVAELKKLTKCRKIVAALRSAGASDEIKDRRGQTAKNYAEKAVGYDVDDPVGVLINKIAIFETEVYAIRSNRKRTRFKPKYRIKKGLTDGYESEEPKKQRLRA